MFFVFKYELCSFNFTKLKLETPSTPMIANLQPPIPHPQPLSSPPVIRNPLSCAKLSVFVTEFWTNSLFVELWPNIDMFVNLSLPYGLWPPLRLPIRYLLTLILPTPTPHPFKSKDIAIFFFNIAMIGYTFLTCVCCIYDHIYFATLIFL